MDWHGRALALLLTVKRCHHWRKHDGFIILNKHFFPSHRHCSQLVTRVHSIPLARTVGFVTRNTYYYLLITFLHKQISIISSSSCKLIKKAERSRPVMCLRSLLFRHCCQPRKNINKYHRLSLELTFHWLQNFTS